MSQWGCKIATSRALVSIGLPVYNGGRYLDQALESLLAQDYPALEIIISDNASQDETGEICRRFVERDPRVRYFRNETNVGAAANFGRVLDLAHGEYFMWAAYDDLWAPVFVSSCVEVLSRDRDLIGCFSSLQFIDHAGLPLSMADGYDNPLLSAEDVSVRVRALMSAGGWYAIYALMRTEVLRSSGGMRAIYGGDVVLLLDLVLRGPFGKVHDVLFSYRQLSEKSEQDRAATMSGAGTVLASFSALAVSLVSTAVNSQTSMIIKMAVLREIFLAMFIRDTPWRWRFQEQTDKSLRAALSERKLRRALTILFPYAWFRVAPRLRFSSRGRNSSAH